MRTPNADLKNGFDMKIGYFSNNVILDSNGVELMYNPKSGVIQIGMGGEWWSGFVKEGNNVLSHKKEDIDEAYRPVVVFVKELESSDLEIRVSGGFGMEATFLVGENIPKNNFH
jgi:hypothetical protein